MSLVLIAQLLMNTNIVYMLYLEIITLMSLSLIGID